MSGGRESRKHSRKARQKMDRDRAVIAGNPSLAAENAAYRKDLRRRRGRADSTTPLSSVFWDSLWVGGKFWAGGPEAPSNWLVDGRPNPGPPPNH